MPSHALVQDDGFIVRLLVLQGHYLSHSGYAKSAAWTFSFVHPYLCRVKVDITGVGMDITAGQSDHH